MGTKQLRSRTLSTHDTTFVCLNIAALSAINNTTLALATHTQPNTAAFVSNRNQFRDSRAKCYMKYNFFCCCLFRCCWSIACCELSCARFCMWSREFKRNPKYARTHTHISIGSNPTTITNVAKWMPGIASNSSDAATCIQWIIMVNWRRNECRANVRKLCFDSRRVWRTHFTIYVNK